MKTIGLTGGIGSGKSLAADCFAQLGATIIDADVIAKHVRAQEDVKARIIAHFGDTIVSDTGELDRRALRLRIFNNKDDKQWLESILHPRIQAHIQTAIQQATGSYCIVVIPLLAESKHYTFLDRVLVIDCSDTLQIKRASERDNSTHENIKAIINAQATREARLKIADDCIDNSGSIEELKEQVETLHHRYSAL